MDDATFTKLLAKRYRSRVFWNGRIGVLLRRIWWHLLNPTKWPERKPTPQEIADFRQQVRNLHG